MPRALAVFAAVCVHCTMFMQRLQAYAVWMLNVHTHKDDGRTKGIAFHSSFKIDAFLFIKSIAKWYKRVSMRDVFCFVLFVVLVLGSFVGWLVCCPLGIAVILSPTSYTVIVICFQQQPFMHTLLAHIIILCASYTCAPCEKKEATIKVVHFSQNTITRGISFYNKVRWISHQITLPSTYSIRCTHEISVQNKWKTFPQSQFTSATAAAAATTIVRTFTLWIIYILFLCSCRFFSPLSHVCGSSAARSSI